VAKATDIIQQLEATYHQQFPAAQPVSALTAAFSASDQYLQENATCQAAINTTIDALDHVISVCNTMDRYIQLTVPKVEDGGNFGVDVQLTASDVVANQVVKLESGVDYLLGYATNRAASLALCAWLATTKTKALTTAVAESTGKTTEKGDTKDHMTTHRTEEKAVDTICSPAEVAHRKQAVVAIDVRFYRKSKELFYAAITGLLLVIDYMDKNQEKIDAPKGDAVSRYQY
jgi:Proteasome activator pa28 beta subunit